MPGIFARVPPPHYHRHHEHPEFIYIHWQRHNTHPVVQLIKFGSNFGVVSVFLVALNRSVGITKWDENRCRSCLSFMLPTDGAHL